MTAAPPLDTTDWDWGPPLEDDDGFWNHSPILANLKTFARARRCSPWAVAGITFAYIANATPPNIMLPALIGGPASLNMFIGITGKSGGGKSAAIDAAEYAVNVGEEVAQAGLGSGEGIAHQYMRWDGKELTQHTKSVMFTLDEIDTFAALNQRKGTTTAPMMRTAWMGGKLGQAFADREKRLRLGAHTYRLTLIAGIQMARAGALLDDTDGGTPQRFLWLPAGDPNAPDTAPTEPPRHRWELPKHLIHPYSERMTMDVCTQARTLIDLKRLHNLRELDTDPTTGEDIDELASHAMLCRLKTAAALALLHGCEAVTDEYWELSGHVSAISDATRLRTIDVLAKTRREDHMKIAHAKANEQVVITEKMAEAATKRVTAGVRKHVAKSGTDGIPHRDLRGKFRSDDRTYIDDALDDLLTKATIIAKPVEDARATQGGTRYILAKNYRP